MKRLLLLTFLLIGRLMAQQGNAVVIPFAGVPAGTCGPLMLGLNQATGDLYTCVSGAWHLSGGGGGTGTVTSFSSGDLAPLATTNVTNPTTTPALAFTISNAAANTVYGNATSGSATPAFGQIVNGQITNATLDLTTKVTGLLPPANGGVCSETTAGIGGFWGGIGMGPPPTTISNTVALSAGGANQVKVLQFTLPCTVTVRKVVMRTGTAVTGGSTGNFGIYCADATIGCTIGAKLIDSGSFATAAASTVFSNTLGAAVTLKPGAYFFAYADTDTAATVSGLSTLASNTQLIYNQNSTRTATAANALSGGVLPATLGALTNSTAVDVPFAFFEP